MVNQRSFRKRARRAGGYSMLDWAGVEDVGDTGAFELLEILFDVAK